MTTFLINPYVISKWKLTDNCQLWLAADSGITKDGFDYVDSWSDQSSMNNNAYILSGLTEFKPLWVDNYLNGKPALCFDGSSNFLKLDNSINLINGNYSIFIVHKLNNLNMISILLFSDLFYSPPSTIRYYTIFDASSYPSSYGMLYFNNPTIKSIASSDDVTYNPVYTEFYNNKLYRNGLESSGYSYTDTINNISVKNIGGNYTEGVITDYYYNGYILEIMIYNIALSGEKQQTVRDYLTNKYF